MTGICAISSVAKAKIREKAHGEPQPELVFMRYNLPHVPYIRTCGETLDKLGRAHSSEEAIAIIRAYIEPQVLDKKRGQPRWSLTTLEHSTPSWHHEMQIVREAFDIDTGVEGNGMGPSSMSAGRGCVIN